MLSTENFSFFIFIDKHHKFLSLQKIKLEKWFEKML